MKDVALRSEPLVLNRAPRRTFLIFTDGSLESEGSGLGGILYDSNGLPLSFFSEPVPEKILNRLRETSRHPIFEVELLAVWVALHLWQRKVEDSFSCFYIDNEAAKGALVAGRTQGTHALGILDSFLQMEDSAKVLPWFGRVPTHSNPADRPSRFEHEHLSARGIERAPRVESWPWS